MKKILLLLSFMILTVTSFTVLAESQDLDRAERIRLSKDLHDIRKSRDRINNMIMGAANAVPEVDREDFQKYVQLKVDYDALEQKSINYAADIYTVPELKAMISYFGSPDGQAAESKGAAFTSKIGKDIIKEIDAAILAAKYDGVPETSLPKIISE
jgi:hypothetical protein